MISKYLKDIWRNMLRDRQFSFLNVTGLSVALTCVLLISLWVADERSVDKFHANDDRLYQVMSHIKLPDGIHSGEYTPYLLSRAVAKEIPEVEDATCLMKGFIEGTLSAGEKHFKTTKYYADYHFFDLFSFRLIYGNEADVLNDKYSVVLSDKLAKQLFNTTDNVVGKTVQWENDPHLFTVSGIFEEPTYSSSLKFDALFSYELFFQSDPDTKDWSNSNPFTFLLLRRETDPSRLDSKLTAFLHAKSDKSPLTLTVRKFSDRHLYDKYENGRQSGGSIRYVQLFSIIAAFILLIACINFMNLSTAKAARRLKEAGIKKILGAERSALIFQYICESTMMAFAALAIAVLLALVLMPEFNHITGKQLSLHFGRTLVFELLSIGMFTGLLAGSYPAFYLSGFKPVNALRGKPGTVWGELWIRKGLVVFQYTLSVIFIVAVMVIYKQMNLIQTIDLGYSKDNIVSLKGDKKIMDNFNAFMTDIKNIPGVLTASSINGDMYGNSSGSTEHANWQGNTAGTKIMMTDLDVDYGLVELLGMKMAAGRSFSKGFVSDSLGIMLNEAAVQAMGIKDPVGKAFEVWGGKYHIIGVAKDFHFESLYEKVKPCFMRLDPAGGNNILVKINGGREREVISKLSDVYAKYNAGIPFDFSFMDQDYEMMYVGEEREAVLLKWFAALAMIISCLGLFGLAAFSAQRRQKEMSIRKVVGASSTDIAALLSKDFLVLVAVAMLVSVPVSWWAMNKWLDGFAYRVSVGTGIFALTFLLIIIVTVITVGIQSVKAALANPVESLRAQ
jgi:ABC-type antimicrobial peptide transport system permease subunit